MWRKLLSLNTRYIYLAIVVMVVIPVILKVPLPTSPSEPTQKLFDHIDTLEAGDGIWFFLDTRPATTAIHRPQLHVLLHHCFSKGIKVVGFNPLASEATGMGRPVIQEIATQYGKQEYTDWAYMRYTPAGLAVFNAMSKDIKGLYSQDVTGKAFDEIPVLQQFRKYSDVGLVITLAGLKTPGYWVRYAQTPYKFPFASGVTGPMIADQFPFLNAGQMVGMMGGILGAAEYEGLLKKNNIRNQFGIASASMFVQTIVHYILVAVIILANVATFIINKQDEKDRQTRDVARARIDSGIE